MNQSPEIQGYCPVAYFLASEPLEGRPEIHAAHDGKVYYFVSEDAKQEFEQQPDRYVPAFGGRCAFGMSIEKEFEPCPRNFKIIDDRLYLFLHDDDTNALELWNREDEARCLASANHHWSNLQQAASQRSPATPQKS